MIARIKSHIERPIWHTGHEEYQDDCFCCRGMLVGRLKARVAQLEAANDKAYETLSGRERATNGEIGGLKANLHASDKKIAALEASMLKHFNEEHLAGDGPEIQRWKNQIAERDDQIETLQAALSHPELLTEKIAALESQIRKLKGEA